VTASRHIALLRGINVGGKHRLPMAELVAVFEAAGARDVATYIQSGNVLFTASAAAARRIPAGVERAIAARFGFEAPVIVRTAAELRRVAGANPFLRAGTDGAGLHVGFLKDRPSAAATRALDPRRSPPDRVALNGRELYLEFPNGSARTRFTSAYLDSTLRTTCTVRNWRTVLTLVEMSAGS